MGAQSAFPHSFCFWELSQGRSRTARWGTLTLRIGAPTAIFTLVHKVMLRSLPVAKPENLYRIGDKIRCCHWGGYIQGSDGDCLLFSREMYKHSRANTPEIVELAALQAGVAPLGVRRVGSQAQADTRNGEYVSGEFFQHACGAAVG
jgi:putative ABC transport system permease protein